MATLWPGALTYSPASGTVLNAGGNQALSVTFTPTDTADFNTANASVQINVLKATPTISWSNPADISYGTPLGARNSMPRRHSAALLCPALSSTRPPQARF